MNDAALEGDGRESGGRADGDPARRPGREGPAFRLATYNVRHGLGDDGVVDVGRFAAAVSALDADVLALQEVEVDSPRSLRADLPRVAARALSADAWRFAPTLRLRGGRWVRAGGGRPGGGPRYGIALATRYPVDRWWRLDLPRLGPVQRARRLAGPLREALEDRPGTLRTLARRAPHLLRDEPRVALVARVRTPAGPLTVVATHLTALETATADQFTALAAAMGRLPGPVVLLGDLNLPPERTRLAGWAPLATAATHPVARPVRQIDHILTDGSLAPTGPGRAVDTGLSDHRALVVDVRFAAGPAG